MATLQRGNTAGTSFIQLFGRMVEAGEEITITKHGAPVAKLVPVKKERVWRSARRHYADSETRQGSVFKRIEGQGPH